MTAAEAYRAEMAKRGLTLAKAEGCPRQVSRRGRPLGLSREQTMARYKKWREEYEKVGSSYPVAAKYGVAPTTIRVGVVAAGGRVRPHGGLRKSVKELRQHLAKVEAKREKLLAQIAAASQWEAA